MTRAVLLNHLFIIFPEAVNRRSDLMVTKTVTANKNHQVVTHQNCRIFHPKDFKTLTISTSESCHWNSASSPAFSQHMSKAPENQPTLPGYTDLGHRAQLPPKHIFKTEGATNKIVLFLRVWVNPANTWTSYGTHPTDPGAEATENVTHNGEILDVMTSPANLGFSAI